MGSNKNWERGGRRGLASEVPFFGDWLGIALPGEVVSGFPGLLSLFLSFFYFLFFPSPVKLHLS